MQGNASALTLRQVSLREDQSALRLVIFPRKHPKKFARNLEFPIIRQLNIFRFNYVYGTDALEMGMLPECSTKYTILKQIYCDFFPLAVFRKYFVDWVCSIRRSY